MPDSLQQIESTIIQAEQQETALNPVPLPDNTPSVTGIRKRWRVVIAGVIQQFQQSLELFYDELNQILLTKKPHTLYWYANKAKAFMYGYELPPFEENYNTFGMTSTQIQSAKIITQSAAVRSIRSNGRPYIRLKVATGVNNDLRPLNEVELVAFRSYMAIVADAGVDVSCESFDADKVVMHWKIEYDPQIIKIENNEGVNIATGEEVVRSAIKKYIAQLPFNGVYQKTKHMDYVQKVQGVRALQIISLLVTYRGDVGTAQPESIFDGLIPDSGWMLFYNDADLTIDYIPLVQ